MITSTATRVRVASDLFLDASYAIALASPRDQHHDRAVELAGQIEADPLARLVTTRAILLEIGNALAKARHRPAAIALINALDRDPRVDVLPFSDEVYREALSLYEQHVDKEWGLTDCISFVVMKELGITDALTADDHFRQAGFRPLLRHG